MWGHPSFKIEADYLKCETAHNKGKGLPYQLRKGKGRKTLRQHCIKNWKSKTLEIRLMVIFLIPKNILNLIEISYFVLLLTNFSSHYSPRVNWFNDKGTRLFYLRKWCNPIHPQNLMMKRNTVGKLTSCHCHLINLTLVTLIQLCWLPPDHRNY